MRRHRPFVVLACLATLVSLAGAAPPRRPQPQILIRETQLTATTEFRWSVGVQFRNPTGMGLYTDSLTAEATDLGPGVTHGPRSRFVPIGFVQRQLPSLGTGDSASLAFQYTALYEHARLVLRYYSHAQTGERFMVADTVEMLPAPFAELCPSKVLHSGRLDIEYYYARAMGGAASVPAVLLVHGDQSHARNLLPLAKEITDTGYNVMAVSQPGYGRSGGEPDLMGPDTQRAVEDALALLRHMPGVDSTRVAVWGMERGGTLAARLAMTRHDLAAAVAIRGMYDLEAVARASKTLGDAFSREAGPDSAAWRQRSPASLPPVLNAPLMVECGNGDPLVPAAQAQAFVYALAQARQPAEIRDLSGTDRPLPYGAARDTAYAFLARLLKR
ncbi:MAG: alpha/beta hydrolase family protein [Candidatus Eisenbacteria bacterium]